jgi:hypothetical protein
MQKKLEEIICWGIGVFMSISTTEKIRKEIELFLFGGIGSFPATFR